MAGHAAVDVIHLLAELIENADRSPPPAPRSRSPASRCPHGYVIEIEDQGLGMTDEELVQANQRLANPPDDRLRPVRVLGLLRGRPPRPSARHQGPAPPLLVRRGDRAGPAAQQHARLAQGAADGGGRAGRRGRDGPWPCRAATAGRGRPRRGWTSRCRTGPATPPRSSRRPAPTGSSASPPSRARCPSGSASARPVATATGSAARWAGRPPRRRHRHRGRPGRRQSRPTGRRRWPRSRPRSTEPSAGCAGRAHRRCRGRPSRPSTRRRARRRWPRPRRHPPPTRWPR